MLTNGAFDEAGVRIGDAGGVSRSLIAALMVSADECLIIGVVGGVISRGS